MTDLYGARWRAPRRADVPDAWAGSPPPASWAVLRAWPEGLCCGPFANLFPHSDAHFRRGAVMDAIVDASVGHLLHERLDGRPTADHAWGRWAGGAQRREWPHADLRLQHGTHGGRGDAMRA